jgi:hypothetical protein
MRPSDGFVALSVSRGEKLLMSSSFSFSSDNCTWMALVLHTCRVSDALMPVKSNASSSGRCNSRGGWDKISGGNERRTKLEKVYASLVSSDVKIFVEESASFESELSQIVAAIVSEKDYSSRFQHLCEVPFNICQHCFSGSKNTFWTLLTALPHSSGWRALITNTKITISTVPGRISEGRPSWDVRSHTDAWMVPSGGDKYKGSR